MNNVGTQDGQKQLQLYLYHFAPEVQICQRLLYGIEYSIEEKGFNKICLGISIKISFCKLLYCLKEYYRVLFQNASPSSLLKLFVMFTCTLFTWWHHWCMKRERNDITQFLAGFPLLSIFFYILLYLYWWGSLMQQLDYNIGKLWNLSHGLNQISKLHFGCMT